MMSHSRKRTLLRRNQLLTLVCCQSEEAAVPGVPAVPGLPGVFGEDNNLEGKETFIERMKQRSKNVLIQRAIAAKIW